MAEHDDGLSRRYRAASREEPPAAIDAAILAASRRAVGARPGGVRRWAGPISIAAVLMLGVGVSLRMQQEKPGIELSSPVSEPAAPAQTAPMQAPPHVPASPPVAADKALAREDARAHAEKRASAPRKVAPALRDAPAETDALQKRMPEAGSAPAAQAIEAPEPRIAAAPQANTTTPAASAPPPAVAATAAPPLPPLAAPAARSKREALAASSDARTAAAESLDPIAIELERIARLRAEGRDAEADKALEEFRRRHPDYRIAEAMWQRVKPR